jgi:hypothetical protein
MADASKSRSQKDKQMAAYLKRLGVERKTGRCAACYRIISIEGPQSRYSHLCPGGRSR